MGAQLVLSQNSYVGITKSDGQYKPIANLHGHMSISLGNNVNLGSFEFSNLALYSEAPYMTVGNFSYPSGLLAGFPVNVSDLAFSQQNNLIGLSMQANVSFMSSESSGFGGNCAFTIWAERKIENGKTKYQYKNTQISGVTIEVNQGGFEFYGAVEIYQQHSVYGNGFRGMIDAKFLPGINIMVSAQFGNVDGYRYWYVDALVSQPTGIPIFSGLAIYGFGGGLSYKMELVEPASYSIPANEHTSADNSDSPGIVFSGATYTPNPNFGLGLKASVVFGTHPSPKAANGQISFRIQFYTGGGVQSIRFTGDLCMASELNSNPASASFRLTVDISYNFTTSDLYGVNEAFINTSVIKGIHPGNKAGSVIFRFNPNEWYVHVGTPDSRIGLKVLNSMTFTSYFMVGTNIPPFPAPPSEVTEILQGTNVQSFEGGLMSTGNGFAFGSTFHMDTGEQSFLIFYGSFSLGVGFDIMLKNYGTTVYCEGFPPPIGVNGWYAMGQSYAYMTGVIGVEFSLFGRDQKMDVLTISAAALLQAKLPNPLFFTGQASGSYDVLGGLLKGNCHFEFAVGEDCVVMGANPLGNISIISDMAPTDSSTDVSVFVTPQVAFNMPIDKPFQLLDANNQTQTYRVRLAYFKVLVNDVEFPGSLVFNEPKDVVSFETTEIYPEFTDVTASVRVIFQRLNNGNWVNFTVNGQLQAEEQSVTFTTGERPDHIMPEHVVYSYPMQGMMNFHWREHGSAYIKLRYNYDYLLDPEPDWIGKAIYEGSHSNNQVNYSYDAANLLISFPIPTNLSSQMVYNVKVSKLPTFRVVEVDENVESIIVAQSDVYEQTEAIIEGDRIVSLERVLYQLNIRTSNYATFSSKLDNMQLGSSATQVVTTGVHNLIKFATLTERLDNYELNYTSEFALIKMEIDLSNNVWYNSYIYPLVYENYPRLPSLNIDWRDTEMFGIPPFKAIHCYQTSTPGNIDDLAPGTQFVHPSASVGFMYTGVLIKNQDFNNLKNKASALYNPSSPNASILLHFIDGFFMPVLLNQQYKAKIRYILPGINTVTTEREITFDI